MNSTCLVVCSNELKVNIKLFFDFNQILLSMFEHVFSNYNYAGVHICTLLNFLNAEKFLSAHFFLFNDKKHITRTP